MTVTMIGIRRPAISYRLRPIASDCPRSSASIPGYAPGVSTNVNNGSSNFSASFISRSALRYPSGRGMPKLRWIFSLVSRPF